MAAPRGRPRKYPRCLICGVRDGDAVTGLCLQCDRPAPGETSPPPARPLVPPPPPRVVVIDGDEYDVVWNG